MRPRTMSIQTFHTDSGKFYRVYFENNRQQVLIEGTAWQLYRWAVELAERTDPMPWPGKTEQMRAFILSNPDWVLGVLNPKGSV